jgi:hypothetical protein
MVTPLTWSVSFRRRDSRQNNKVLEYVTAVIDKFNRYRILGMQFNVLKEFK